MKKRLTKVLTVLLSVIIGAACFCGCNVVTDNAARDLDQVVATVNVNRKENIYKKDLIMAYMNYGYIYTQYYGYDAARTYNLILNGLIENRIIVQVAYEIFEENSVVDDTKDKYTAERYLGAEEITEAKYTAYKSINDLLDGYADKDGGAAETDALIFDVRTVPTNAAKAEKDVDKAAYVADIEQNGFDVNSDENRRAAFNRVVTLLKDNGLLGEDYDGTINGTDYFKRLLKSNLESKIIEKYEESVVAEIKNNLAYSELETAYTERYNAQKEWSNSEFVSKLSSASASEPVLYSAYGVYGYVYNLLLGVNDYQSEKLSELQEESAHNHYTEEKYAEERAKILAGTIAKDLRASWILSGYDFDFATKKFTGDYTFAKIKEQDGEGNDLAYCKNSLPFQGEVQEIKQKTDDEDGVYAVTGVTTYGLEAFKNFVNGYIYGDETVGAASADYNIFWEYDSAVKPEEYDAKINELLFAFSTDSGSLNTYKGYVVKPDNNDYVKTFGDAGKQLLEDAANNGYKSSYKAVASDYGYHFMFFSEVWTADFGYATLGDYLDTLNIDKGTATWEQYFNAQKDEWDDFAEENNFLYILANDLISAKLSDAASRSRTNIVTKYRYGENKDSTVIYKDRFADLLG